jgi:hypothetical protein
LGSLSISPLIITFLNNYKRTTVLLNQGGFMRTNINTPRVFTPPQAIRIFKQFLYYLMTGVKYSFLYTAVFISMLPFNGKQAKAQTNESIGATIQGHVVVRIANPGCPADMRDAEYAPPAPGKIKVVVKSKTGRFSRAIDTDPNGYFNFSGLPDDTYEIYPVPEVVGIKREDAPPPVQINAGFNSVFALLPLVGPYRVYDTDAMCNVNVADAVFLLDYLYSQGTAPEQERGDVNADGSIDLSDAVSVLNYMFGPPQDLVNQEGGPIFEEDYQLLKTLEEKHNYLQAMLKGILTLDSSQISQPVIDGFLNAFEELKQLKNDTNLHLQDERFSEILRLNPTSALRVLDEEANILENELFEVCAPAEEGEAPDRLPPVCAASCGGNPRLPWCAFICSHDSQFPFCGEICGADNSHPWCIEQCLDSKLSLPFCPDCIRYPLTPWCLARCPEDLSHPWCLEACHFDLSQKWCFEICNIDRSHPWCRR